MKGKYAKNSFLFPHLFLQPLPCFFIFPKETILISDFFRGGGENLFLKLPISHGGNLLFSFI